jgi:hypothetical protein
MSTEIVITCDECRSPRVDEYTKCARFPRRLSMSEYIQVIRNAGTMLAVVQQDTMVLRCRDCGHIVEYTRQTG